LSTIDLIWLGTSSPPDWSLGQAWRIDAEPASIDDLVRDRLPGATSRAWLFWDEGLGQPEVNRVRRALSRPGDIWHCGLRLGMGGLPGVIDHVMPTWMLNCDAAPDTESTSWRLSLRACLARVEVLRALGAVRQGFTTLDGAALEMGHRFVKRGVLTRHVPWLLPDGPAEPTRKIPPVDEILWLRYRTSRFWTLWAVWRAVAVGRFGLWEAVRAVRATGAMEPPPDPPPFVRVGVVSELPGSLVDAQVAVLVPTLDRYPYLLTLLDQLRHQTVPPAEVIVVDQTVPDRRMNDLAGRFPDLPLTVIQLDQPGQCSSRNLGLIHSRQEYILFVDDDDEVEPDLIERHLRSLHRHGGDVSSGVTSEADGTELPADFTLLRASDVFPTNNTLVHRGTLQASGLFDLAYDRGARADGDLGMRVYLSGKLMVLDPSIVLLHHHAPSGGLRAHRARKVTYASSQRSFIQRHLPSPTEIYLGLRYFARDQVREMLWIRVLQTLRIRGGPTRRVVKWLVGAALLPSTLCQVGRSYRRASDMGREFPQIGRMPEVP
jgi:glycosyltransferase involved in cell wall biosynthesis